MMIQEEIGEKGALEVVGGEVQAVAFVMRIGSRRFQPAQQAGRKYAQSRTIEAAV